MISPDILVQYNQQHAIPRHRILSIYFSHAEQSKPYRLDQSFFWRYFQHVVELQSRRGQLLLGGSVVTLPPPLSSGHHKEDKQTDKCYESHTTHYGSDYEGQFFCLRGLNNYIRRHQSSLDRDKC